MPANKSMRTYSTDDWLQGVIRALEVLIRMPNTPTHDIGWLLERVQHFREENEYDPKHAGRVAREDLANFDEEFPGLLPLDLVMGPPIPSKFLNAPDPILPPAPGTTQRAIMAMAIESPSDRDIELLGDALGIAFESRQSPWWGGDFYFANGERFEKVYLCRTYRYYGADDGGPVLAEAHPRRWFLRLESTQRDIEQLRAALEAQLRVPVQIVSTTTI